MDTVGVLVSPWKVDAIKAVGDKAVWAASGGLVTTAVTRPSQGSSQDQVTEKESSISLLRPELKGPRRANQDRPYDSSVFTTFSPLQTVHIVQVSPCGKRVVCAGEDVYGKGLLAWQEWPLVPDSSPHTIITGHVVHHIEFSSKGDVLGILSSIEDLSCVDWDMTRNLNDEESSGHAELLLSLWSWPENKPQEDYGVIKTGEEENTGPCNTLETQEEPGRLVVTSLPQLRSEHITRMSMARGLPEGVVAVMIAAEEELCICCLEEGPLGRRLVTSTVGFGLLLPDSVYSMWCLAPDAYALGVGGGWVMVGVNGEVVVRVGGGRGGPCHQGPLTDLALHGTHLYTIGGDGWLRVWDAETLEEAVISSAGVNMSSCIGWSEAGVRSVYLQQIRELDIHKGPGVPVTLIPTITSHTVWLVQTNTGVVYGVWVGEWTAHVLHQGPSGRVTGVALAPTRPLLATTTNHRYLLVTALRQLNEDEDEENGESDGGRIHGVSVPSSVCFGEVKGCPRCVTWATCQVSGEDDLLVVGLEDGSVNLFLMHKAVKNPGEKLTLVQVERPHETAIIHISATKKVKSDRGGITNSVVVTAGEDCRVFIFRLYKAGRMTRLEPVGFHQLDAEPRRFELKEDRILVEMCDGITIQIPVSLPSSSTTTATTPHSATSPTAIATTARTTPNSWLLQQDTGPQELWEGVTVIRQQLLQEVAESCCSDGSRRLLLTIPSGDGSCMISVTRKGRVVHLHRSQMAYSVRLSDGLSSTSTSYTGPASRAGHRSLDGHHTEVDLLMYQKDTTTGTSINLTDTTTIMDKPVGEDDRHGTAEKVVGCVSDDGMWASAWVEGGDLMLYRARGASFPTPQEKRSHLRHIDVRGVGVTTAGASLEQRAQKEAGERHRLSMEERANLLQQKLSKLKWDFRKLTLRAEETEGGRTLLEELPLHPNIVNTLHQYTTANMNKVVAGSSPELEMLEVLLGKLRTLYSWNPLVSNLSIKTLGSEETLEDIDVSQEIFALLTQLIQVRQIGGEENEAKSHTVKQVRDLLEFWFKIIRFGKQPQKQSLSGHKDQAGQTESGEVSRQDTATSEDQRMLRPTTAASRGSGSGEGDGDTSDEAADQDSIAGIRLQVREVVNRVASASRTGGGDGTSSEADLDVGRQLNWRKTALTRLKEYRSRENSRAAQVDAYKTEHSVPLQEMEGDGEGSQAEEEENQNIEDEVTVPPPSLTAEEVESQLWRLLGKVEAEAKKTHKQLNEAAATQANLLEQVNQWRSEWGHTSLTLAHIPHHQHVKVKDELVNEFYCDLLDLEDPKGTATSDGGAARGKVAGGSTQRATSTPRRTKSSPRTSTPGRDADRWKRQDTKKESEETDVPPLSLTGSPRLAKSTKTPRTSRTARTARTPTSSSGHTVKTQRTGRRRKSARESPKPPPTPRPPISLDQVQQIQHRRTSFLTSLTQVPETLQEAAKETDSRVSECWRKVLDQRGRLAWAVLRSGQLVRTVGIRAKYRAEEKKLRVALKERIHERQVVKEKVLALRERIQGYDGELECLAGLEEEVNQAFSNLVTDHAQFEVQLTRYFESSGTSGNARRNSVMSSSSSSSGDEDDGGRDSGDNDSGLGTDEARMEETGPRPPGCDAGVFSLVTQLRDLRLKLASAVERCGRERSSEERRHAAVMRRLMRATHLTHAAHTSLTSLQNQREKELETTSVVVWMRSSQTSGNISDITRVPIPNFEADSLASVKWPDTIFRSEVTLLTQDHLNHLEQRVQQAKLAQQLAARRHREGRAERRSLTQQVEQLKEKLTELRSTYQVTKACKLGEGADADLALVEEKLESALDQRWSGKVASQITRHSNNMSQLQADAAGRTRELRALQKEEAALCAHILALRQEKDHLLYHMAQTKQASTSRQKGTTAKSVGGVKELERLRSTITHQDTLISALRREISSLRSKTGSVVLPGLPPPLPATLHSSSSPPATPRDLQSQEEETTDGILTSSRSFPQSESRHTDTDDAMESSNRDDGSSHANSGDDDVEETESVGSDVSYP